VSEKFCSVAAAAALGFGGSGTHSCVPAELAMGYLLSLLPQLFEGRLVGHGVGVVDWEEVGA
jgi:hypothetical protein